MKENLKDNKLDDNSLEKVSGGTEGTRGDSKTILADDSGYVKVYNSPEKDECNVMFILCTGEKVELLDSYSNSMLYVYVPSRGVMGWVEERFIEH